MSHFFLENDQLKITVNSKGAELTSLVRKDIGLEYMWGGDPLVWGKHSPVLFPIVGTLKNNRYFFNGKAYELSRHGFAREQQFELAEQGPAVARFVLRESDDTLAVYPFYFNFFVEYQLQKNKLLVFYEVVNTGSSNLYFSVGAHPAFAVPLVAGTAYEDYYLEFEKEEPLARWPITANGLIDANSVSVPQLGNRLALSKAMFSKDALVFKHLKSAAIRLKSSKTMHGLNFSFPGFPYLGIWAAKGGDFVCIEPWCGIADSVHSNQQLEQKEGIQQLLPQTSWKRSWQVELF